MFSFDVFIMCNHSLDNSVLHLVHMYLKRHFQNENTSSDIINMRITLLVALSDLFSTWMLHSSETKLFLYMFIAYYMLGIGYRIISAKTDFCNFQHGIFFLNQRSSTCRHLYPERAYGKLSEKHCLQKSPGFGTWPMDY